MGEDAHEEYLDSLWQASRSTAVYALEEAKLIARESLGCDEPAVIAQIASSIVVAYSAKATRTKVK